MTCSLPGAVSLRAFASVLAFLLVPFATLAAEVDCKDPKTKSACVECGDGKIFCCLKGRPCTVINELADAPYAPVQVGESGDGLKLDFQRTGTVNTGVDIALDARFLPKVFDQPVKLKAHLSGADAETAGLLYPVAYLRLGDSALDLLHAQGLDVEVKTTESVPCDRIYQHQTRICSHLANVLSERIEGELEKQGSLERESFRAGVQASDFGFCPAAAPRAPGAEATQ